MTTLLARLLPTTWMKYFLGSLLLVCLASQSEAQVPEIEELSPLGTQRGSSVELTFGGQRLDTVQDVLFANPGIELVDIQADAEDQLTVKLRVNNDCALGENPFWLIGRSGPSAPRVLQIGPYPVEKESEPNDSMADASVVDATGVTLSGVVEGADIDSYRVDLSAGDRLSASVVAIRLGGSFLDAHLELIGPDGEVLAAMDDSKITKQDPHLSVVAKQTGPHYLRVRDSAFDGEYMARYLLHVSKGCQPVLAYPAGGKPGEKIDSRLIGDGKGVANAIIALPGNKMGYYLHHHNDDIGGPSMIPLPLRVVELTNVLEAEDYITSAGSPPYALNGIASKPGEVDEYRLDLNAGERWSVKVFGKRVGSSIDSVVEVLGPDGEVVAMNDDSAMHDSEFLLSPFQSGPHVLRIKDHLGGGGDGYVYRIEIRKPRPELQLATSKMDAALPQSPQAITLEPGGRAALLLTATRRNFSGPIQLQAKNLPSGVRATLEPIDDTGHLSQVVFEADSRASPGASLIGFEGQASLDGSTVRGELKQTIGLVRGEPRQTVYFGIQTNKLPLVVAPSLPYRIEIESPKASLSQDGLMLLRVKAQRRGDFDGPITLTALKLPRWIERSEDEVLIPAGETSGEFPLISGKRAEPGNYQVVLVASGRVDGIEVETSSLIAQITVDKAYAEVTMQRASAKQNDSTQIHCKLLWSRQPAGPVTARLLGLPKFTEANEVEISPGQTEFTFDVQVGDESPVALHNTLYLELKIPESGEYRREYHARGSVLEVLSSGAKPRDSRSRLEILRDTAQNRPVK